MKKKLRRIIGSILIWTGLIGIILNSIYLAYFSNPAILQALAQRSLIINIILGILMWFGGAWGMKS